MQFEIRHRFPCPPGHLWALVEAPAFDVRLAQESGATRETIERREVGGELYVRRRISTRRDLPAPMKKVVGTDRITYDQESWHRAGGDTLRWKISPLVLGDRFRGEGQTILRATADGCERIIRGELSIRVPLLGSTMEKRLIDDVTASYDLAARIATQMLAAGWTPP